MSPTTNRYELIYRLFSCSAVALALALVMAIWHLGNNSMIACGFMGAFFIHVGTRPARRDVAIAILSGSGFGLCYFVLGVPFGGDFVKAFTGLGAFLGLGSLVTMSSNRILGRAPDQSAALRDAFLIPVFSLVAGIVMDQVGKWNPPTYDLFLYSFDRSLGFAPGSDVASLFKTIPILGAAAGITYAFLLLFPPFYHAWTIHRRTSTGINLMHAFAIGGVCGAILYQVCPAIGPLYCFGRGLFPFHMPEPADLNVALYPGTGIHNAMPSMHMTWALLVWWSAWELTPLARWIASVFVALTFLSTLGSGEHYLVDLIVAVPLALTIESICAWKLDRRGALRGLLTGFGFTIGWLALLRTSAGAHLPVFAAWTLTLATIAVTAGVQFGLRRRLRRSARAGAPPQLETVEQTSPVAA